MPNFEEFIDITQNICDHENDWFAWEIIRISCNFKKPYQMQILNMKTFSIFNRPQIRNICKNSGWEMICFGKTFSAIAKQERVFGFLRRVFVDYRKHF